MKRKWTEEEIWKWYKNHEWISGFNFVPVSYTHLGFLLVILLTRNPSNMIIMLNRSPEYEERMYD